MMAIGHADQDLATERSLAMETDLFLALLDKENPRGHPVLAAWLYAYCPAAARWWLAGADPVQPTAANGSSTSPGAPFNPAWQALTDLAAGLTLKEALSRHGFEMLVDDAREYVAQVDAWRDRHSGIAAPELLPSFTGGRLALSKRFGMQEEINSFGGRWENFFVYVRAWAFLIPGWQQAMGFAAPPELTAVRLVLTAAGVRRPAYFQAWSWVSVVGDSRRQVIGLLATGRGRDQVLLGLVGRSGPVGEAPWPALPEVWVLDPERGQAEPADRRLPEEELPGVVARLAELAEAGPHPPLRALQGPDHCKSCGFQAQCYLSGGEISPLTLAFD
jgi:hypothetical protein